MMTCAALLAAALAAAAPPGSRQGAEEFLDAIYSGFVTPHASTWIGHEEQFFTAPIVTLLKEDRRLAKDEVGVLDGDPFCDCQDFGKVRYTIAVAPPAQGRTKATVRFTNLGALRVFRYDLVSTADGWLIDDFHTARTPSFKGWLTKAVAAERAGR